MNHSIRTLTTTACLGLLATIGVACGDDAEAESPTTTADTVADHTGDEHAGNEDAVGLMIDGVDYGYGNVPASVPAGTRLGLTNTSDVELHELVAFRLADDAQLPELLEMPPAELEAALGAPVTVILQPPGAPESVVAVGDGTLTEPGRYVLMCFIPIGADPEVYMAAVAAAGGGKPEGVAGGPPHFTAGMVAELTVE